MKLTQGMQEHYQSGLPNAVKSLQAQMTDASNALLEKMREMGEQLRPLYTEILKDIKGAFDSEPVQWFVANLKEIVKVAGFAVEVWATYKGIMLLVEGGQSALNAVQAIGTSIQIAQAAALRGTTVAKVQAMVATGELTAAELAYEASISGVTAATAGLGIALDTLGIGLLAAGIATIVNEFINWNKQIDDTVDGITHIKQIHEEIKNMNDSRGQANSDFRQFMAGQLSGQESSEAYSNVASLTDRMHKQWLNNQDKLSQDMIKLAGAEAKYNKFSHTIGGGHRSIIGADDATLQLPSVIKKLKDDIAFMQRDLPKEHAAFVELLTKKDTYEAMGVKPPSYTLFKDPKEGHNNGALSMVDMTGARGGLGEARVINIKFDGPFFQAVGVKESKDETSNAVSLLARAINNLSASQSQTY